MLINMLKDFCLSRTETLTATLRRWLSCVEWYAKQKQAVKPPKILRQLEVLKNQPPAVNELNPPF